MSSDRSDGGEPGQAGQGALPLENAEPKPIERSSRGRVVIRSSSHPPDAEREAQPLDPREHSGARPLPASSSGHPRGSAPDIDERADARSKKATPAERPRRRRQIQAAQAERSRQDTPAARPVARRRRGIDPLATPANHLVADVDTQPTATHVPSFGDGDSTRSAREDVRARRSIKRSSIAIAIALLVTAALWLLLRG